MHASIFPQGTRVKVQKGRFPIDSEIIGRVGIVTQLDEYRPQQYGVVLDGEERVREFMEDELTVEPS